LPRSDCVLIKRLQTGGSLAADEIQALTRIIRLRRQVSRHNDIVLEGTSPDHCTLILSGFACRYKLLPDGGRQIHAFKIPEMCRTSTASFSDLPITRSAP
jgi:CRP-like cAMP-binding protein